MSATFTDDFVSIYHGDCLTVMSDMEPESVDAIVTDPPYGLSFMGREWDHGVPGEAFWREVLRIAKPGAHLVAFGGARTYHRLACAIEDAGWEVRDTLGWLYGSGFPKSLNVSKAIDKEAGEAVAIGKAFNFKGGTDPKRADEFTENGRTHVDYSPISEAAQRWQGWGTALKPAWEPCILARKPLTGTVAANVQRYGTGALNIDGCRVATDGDDEPLKWERPRGMGFSGGTDNGTCRAVPTHLGRWPANIVHDGSDEVLAVFPQTSSNSGTPFTRNSDKFHERGCYGAFNGEAEEPGYYGDSGSAARFFYCAKADSSERNEGIYGGKNTHPTVKPVALMRWLVRLVTPPDGIVLDPFMGSGTTLKAARAEGHRSIGIDLEREHCEIAWGRLSQGVLL